MGYSESNRDTVSTQAQISQASGTAYDPDAVRAFVRCFPKALVPPKQREVLLSELQPGMVLAKGIYTATGILLIPDGQVLSETYIDKVLNHNRVDPIAQSLRVYC